MLSCLVNASHNHSATNYFKNNSKIPKREPIYRRFISTWDVFMNAFIQFLSLNSTERVMRLTSGFRAFHLSAIIYRIVKHFTLISIIACLHCSCHVFRRQNNVCAMTEILCRPKTAKATFQSRNYRISLENQNSESTHLHPLNE